MVLISPSIPSIKTNRTSAGTLSDCGCATYIQAGISKLPCSLGNPANQPPYPLDRPGLHCPQDGYPILTRNSGHRTRKDLAFFWVPKPTTTALHSVCVVGFQNHFLSSGRNPYLITYPKKYEIVNWAITLYLNNIVTINISNRTITDPFP